ncbi:MAG: AAA family ATPase [Xanthomonadales bacterium]|nr:AAA family ATPase [Xanthomonadales bacterium]
MFPDQQVADHLKRLNPWWSGAGMDGETLALRPRAYLDPVRRLLRESSLRRAIVLLGPRRVGKTILIRHLIADLLATGVAEQRISYVEMDHPLLHGQSLERSCGRSRFRTRRRSVRYLFFDEIQSHKDWEKYLRRWSITAPTCAFRVSGSAAAALKRAEYGIRRKQVHRLPAPTADFLRVPAIAPGASAIRIEGQPLCAR